MNLNNYNAYQADINTSNSQQVLRNTYLLLALSLIPTAIGALIGINMSFAFMRGSPIMSSLILIAAMYGLIFMVEKNKNSFAGIIWMMIFTLGMGLLLGPLLQFALRVPNGSSLILLAALLTSAVFFVMSAIAFTVKREMPMLGNFLTVGAVVLFIAIIANIFFRLVVHRNLDWSAQILRRLIKYLLF